MNKLQNTAKKLDTFFKVIGILLTIGAVGALVALGIIAVGWIFRLAPEQIGSGYNELNLGFASLRLAQAYAPNPNLVLLQTALTCAMGLVIICIGKQAVKCVRQILAPMQEGKPFHDTISTNLKKLGTLSLILGIAVNLSRNISMAVMLASYDIVDLIIGDKITHISFTFDMDLTFLVTAAVFYLLSYIFSYGQQLQQEADETL